VFFDDQRSHLQSPAGDLPMVHVPFGVANRSGPKRLSKQPLETPQSNALQKLDQPQQASELVNSSGSICR